MRDTLSRDWVACGGCDRLSHGERSRARSAPGEGVSSLANLAPSPRSNLSVRVGPLPTGEGYTRAKSAPIFRGSAFPSASPSKWRGARDAGRYPSPSAVWSGKMVNHTNSFTHLGGLRSRGVPRAVFFRWKMPPLNGPPSRVVTVAPNRGSRPSVGRNSPCRYGHPALGIAGAATSSAVLQCGSDPALKDTALPIRFKTPLDAPLHDRKHAPCSTD